MNKMPTTPRKEAPRGRAKSRTECKVCEHDLMLTYKQPDELKRYMNKLGKILPRRASRLCAKHQRQLSREVKRARKMALLPYEVEP